MAWLEARVWQVAGSEVESSGFRHENGCCRLQRLSKSGLESEGAVCMGLTKSVFASPPPPNPSLEQHPKL